MSTLLAIDSGSPTCACATAVDGLLTRVFVADASADVGAFDAVIVELPTLRGNATPNPEDLILIAIAGARLAERAAYGLGAVREVRPAEWKGNTPKPAHHRRVWAELTDAERELLGCPITAGAIELACRRGAADRWAKPGARYYRASDFPTVRGLKITHDLLDAAALALFALGRIDKTGRACGGRR